MFGPPLRLVAELLKLVVSVCAPLTEVLQILQVGCSCVICRFPVFQVSAFLSWWLTAFHLSIPRVSLGSHPAFRVLEWMRGEELSFWLPLPSLHSSSAQRGTARTQKVVIFI